MSETMNISEIAKLVSQEVFGFFRWESLQPYDENYNCCFQDEHFPSKTEDDKTNKIKTHPTDVCFKYYDPYTGKYVYLLTDLKSYAKGTINTSSIRDALNSLTKSVACAKVSEEWQQRYNITGKFEINGLLFVYNHDNSFSRDFYDYFGMYSSSDEINKNSIKKPIQIKNLKMHKSTKIFIAEPNLIQKLLIIVNDIAVLKSQFEFPNDDSQYRFFYPQKQKSRVNLTDEEKVIPATFEMITSSYFIVEHDPVVVYCQKTKMPITKKDSGYIIYYKDEGSTKEEFVYLLDALSGLQLLRENKSIMIRCVSNHQNKNLISNFQAAKEFYISRWDLNAKSIEIINSIKFDRAITIVKQFCSTDLGWKIR